MRATIVGLALLTLVPRASAQEEPARSKISSAGLFKNGLSVIKRVVDLPGPGTYRFDDLPDPVHGTWWVESATDIETTSKIREVEVAVESDVQFQRDLAGKKVTIYFKGGRPDPVSGTVLKMPAPKEPETMPRDRYGREMPVEAAPFSRFLILKTARGRMFIDSGDISIVEAEGDGGSVKKEKKPVLLVHAPKAKNGDKIFVTYLTHGLAWAPSYRVDITDPKQLTIELAAVVKNELSPLEDADLRLISGFPSVQFAHVRSPLSPLQTWTNFFQEITSSGDSSRSNALTQQRVIANVVAPDFGLNMAAKPQGEGVDLHYQPIGKRSLAKGETLNLSIARDKAAYERIVEWLIRDNRDAGGRYRGREEDGTEIDEDAWDALRFKNPFAFPMTTGPAMVTAAGKFNGQRTSYYVNAGEETMLRITKALSVRTRHIEQEIQGKEGERDFIYVGGHRYMRSKLKADITVSNHRKEDIKMVIRRRFSGDLVSADGSPRLTLREEGAYSVNRRYEMVWTLNLKSGEERTLSYQYTLLVSH